MYTMAYDITIGNYKLGMLAAVSVHKSVELLADTCEITLPAAQLNLALDVESRIRRGDRVTVKFGYKETELVKEFCGWLQRIATDGGDIKLFCEDDLFTFRKDIPNEVLKKVSLSELLAHIIKGVGKDYKVNCTYTWTYAKFVIHDATGYDVLKKVQEECGADIYLQDGTLHIHPPGEVTGAERRYDFALNLEETDEQDSENVSRYSINSFSAISETQKENLIFLNIQDTFPKININNYLFTKIQRGKMGLPVSDDEKQIEIFKFYQNILGAKNVYLSYVKNLDENIDSAGVVEEIKLKYAIEAQKNKIDENDELNFIKKYFLENVEKSWESRQIGKFIPSKLKKDLDRIKAEKVSLGYYSFEEMQNFEYGYYLKKMIGNTEVEKIEDKVDNLMFGNIIHGLYEKIVMENKEVLEKGKFVINNEEIRKTLKSILNSFEYKIPKEYLEFYKKVSFEEIVKSVEKILTKLMKTLENEEEIEIYSEERIKLKSEKKIYENIFINGMIDLHIKLKNKEILYDYKSGILKNKKGEEKKEKVVNAFKQLDYYSVMLPEKNVQEIERFVVDVWNGDIIGDTREKEEEFLSEKNIREVVKKYYETDCYDIGDVKDVQNYTYQTFKDVCRREDELNDENK